MSEYVVDTEWDILAMSLGYEEAPAHGRSGAINFSHSLLLFATFDLPDNLCKNKTKDLYYHP